MNDLKLFVIDSDLALRVLFEELYKDRVYTLEDLTDVGFRLPDFSPELVLVDSKLYLADPEAANKSLEVCADIPCTLVGFQEEVEKARSRGWEKAVLLKPLEVSTLKGRLGDLHAQLSKETSR